MSQTNRRLLYIISGSKGGTGKSMVAAGILNSYIGQQASVELLESDISNPDVMPLVGDIPMKAVEKWGTLEGWQKLAQECQASRATVAVLNSRAGDVTAFESFLRGTHTGKLGIEEWEMAKAELTDILAACGRRIVYCHVMRREPVNVQLARDVLPWLPESVAKVALRNLYYGGPEEFHFWNNSQTRQAWLARRGIEVNWPAATDHLMARVYQLGSEAKTGAADLKTCTDYAMVTGKVLLDTTRPLPMANMDAMRKAGATEDLISCLYHHQQRINRTVAEIERQIW
jgi:hypothetical protein